MIFNGYEAIYFHNHFICSSVVRKQTYYLLLVNPKGQSRDFHGPFRVLFRLKTTKREKSHSPFKNPFINLYNQQRQ